ncbi:MAG: threonylcarbamoyl-AMP synthase [Myxococcales bacterium]|nr:threonylcarbamoyl-AMP synthase [Myxococcales bacterium]MCB9521179.1 threonylcarbamoyl-AMP synthase [Myxococcales bacterium]MCB9530537.1 threonylcarbamoyl-AMP synthase [Myxococcales bacterium]
MGARAIELDAYYPRPDRVAELAAVLRAEGLIAFPTDTTWVLGCDAQSRAASSRLAELRAAINPSSDRRGADEKPLSLMCADLAAAASYVLMDQSQFRLVRRLLPGAYTVILPASRQVPRQLQSKRRAVGVRIPSHDVARAILEAADGPLLVTTCHDRTGALMNASPEVMSAWGRELDAIVETDPIEAEATTVVDWTGDAPVLIRAGRGPVEPDWA